MLAAMVLAIAPLRFHVDASEFANVSYHVGCLAESIPCTKTNFEKFWHEDLHWTPEDQAQLDRWREIIRKIADAAPQPPASPFMCDTVSCFPSVSAKFRIFAAAVESRSPNDFRRRAVKRTLLSPEDADGLSRALSHFQRRLEPWWRSTGKKAVASRIRVLQQAMRKDDLEALAAQLAVFVEAEFPYRDVFMHLIAAPDPQSKNANAFCPENHFVIEILDRFKPAEASSLYMHELTHAIYDSMPFEKRIALMKQFQSSPEPRVTAFYAQLNESLATGVQLLVGQRKGFHDDDPYHDLYVPRLGNATVVPLQESLRIGRTIFDGFVASYMRAASAALKDEANSPRFILSQATVLTDDDAAAEAFRREFTPHMWERNPADWRKYSDANIVVLLNYDQAAKQEGIPKFEELKQKRGFACMLPHNGKGSVYVVAGRDPQSLIEAIQHLAKLPQSAEGLLFTISGN